MTPITANNSQQPQDSGALPEYFSADALLDWLNHEMGLARGILTSEQVDVWYMGLPEERRREVRVSYSWWLARFSAQ